MPTKPNQLVLFLSISLLCSFGCTNVYFTSTQPPNEKALDAIPTELHGSYDFEDDLIEIVAEGFNVYSIDTKEISIENLEKEGFIIENGRLYYKDDVTKIFEYEKIEEGYRVKHTSKDTFRLHKGIEVFKYYDAYLLNMQEEEGWSLIRLRERNDDLLMSGIYIDSDKTEGILMDLLNACCEKSEEKSGLEYICNPTRQQFDALMDAGFFSEEGTLKALK